MRTDISAIQHLSKRLLVLHYLVKDQQHLRTPEDKIRLDENKPRQLFRNGRKTAVPAVSMH